MKIYAVRHTSVAVDPGVCYGQTDVKLAYSFQEEKGKVLDSLSELEFDKVYSSPLLRCKKLAETLFGKQEIVFDDRLKELNFGNWELQKWDDIYSQAEGKVWMDNYQTLPTKNGESYPEMVQRVQEFLEKVKQTECENVAVVTHAGVVRILKSIIENKSIDELFKSFKPAYGSVTEFII